MVAKILPNLTKDSLYYQNFNKIDIRQKIIKIKTKNKNTVEVCLNTPVYEFFFINLYNSQISLFSNTQQNNLTYFYTIPAEFIRLVSLILHYSLNHLQYTLVDLFSTSVKLQHIFWYSWVSYLYTLRLQFALQKSKDNYSVLSIQFLIPNSIWPEREVVELSDFSLLYAKDTRNLLQDYTFTKKIDISNNTLSYTNYNEVFFEYFN